MRPFRFEATGILAEGENQLEVLVTNGTANFLAAARGDQPPPLTQLPVELANWVKNSGLPPLAVLVAILVVYIGLGCVNIINCYNPNTAYAIILT